MIIERTEDEIIIRLPAAIAAEDLQMMVDYFAYKEATIVSQSVQEGVDSLSALVKKGRGALADRKLHS